MQQDSSIDLEILNNTSEDISCDLNKGGMSQVTLGIEKSKAKIVTINEAGSDDNES